MQCEFLQYDFFFSGSPNFPDPSEVLRDARQPSKNDAQRPSFPFAINA